MDYKKAIKQAEQIEKSLYELAETLKGTAEGAHVLSQYHTMGTLIVPSLKRKKALLN